MKVVFDTEAPTATLAFEQLEDGKVYTDVSDENDDDLYLSTDLGQIVRLSDGMTFDAGDGWPATHRFLEVDVTLVVKK